MTLGTGLLVILQIAAGMVVNLYTSVPRHHPGARPRTYLTGSLRSVAWALSSGPVALAVHTALGLAVVAMAIVLAVHAVVNRAGWVTLTSVLGAAMVVGAAFNGASFLDFGNQTVSLLIMALLALGSLSCYLVSAFLLASRRTWS